MTNLFTDIRDGIKGQKLIALVWLLSVVVVGIGLVLSADDLMSSREGVDMLEGYGVTAATWPVTAWALALTPQAAQVLFFYLYATDSENNGRFLWYALLALSVDLITDVQFRSGGALVPFDATQTESIIYSTILSVLAFTIGSEVLLTTGLGLVLELFAPAVVQLKQIGREIKEQLDGIETNRSARQRNLNHTRRRDD